MEMVIAHVHEIPKMYPIAADGGWHMVAAHQIDINDYKMLAVPMLDKNNQRIVVFEKTSGCGVAEFQIGPAIADLLETQEKAVSFFEMIIVPRTFEIIRDNREGIDAEIERMKALAFEQLGEQPPESPIDLETIEKAIKKGGRFA